MGILPKSNLSLKLNKNLRAVASVESRQYFYEKNTFDYRYVLTDFQIFLSYKLSPGKSLNSGFIIRTENERTLYRLSQQYSVVKKYNAFRQGHRFGLDVTWGGGTDVVSRMRYRLTYEKPLSGERVDPSEMYIKLGNEVLFIIAEDPVFNLEYRLLPNIGYEINYNHKIEGGLDIRIRDIISEGPAFRMFFAFTWYVNI